MRRASDQPHIRWKINIAGEDAAALQARLPLVGTKAWLVDTALGKFLEVVEDADEGTLRLLHQDIQHQLYNEPKSVYTTPFAVLVRAELYERFNKVFPEYGAATWFVRRVICFFLQETKDLMLDEDLERSVNRLVYAPQMLTREELVNDRT